MHLKGVRKESLPGGRYRVTPLFFGKRGSTIKLTAKSVEGSDLESLVDQVLRAARPAEFTQQ